MRPIFARITKVDEETRTVTGRATQEVVDRDNEIMDYASSKPEFMKWSAEVHADTGGKSLGNVRSMHGNIAAGKVVDIDFNDVEKAIDITAKIIDDNEWEKVLEGVHTGFSIGGRYSKKWAVPINGKMVQRYTAVPSEISIVDRPCCPTAKFFNIHKRDGSIVQKAFATQIELVDGVIMLKGGPGSGPRGGGGGGRDPSKDKGGMKHIGSTKGGSAGPVNIYGSKGPGSSEHPGSAAEQKAAEKLNNKASSAYIKSVYNSPGSSRAAGTAENRSNAARFNHGNPEQRASAHERAADSHDRASSKADNEKLSNMHASIADSHRELANVIRSSASK